MRYGIDIRRSMYIHMEGALNGTVDMATAEVGQSEQDTVQYPLRVEYCGLCTMPPEYCEYGPTPSKCYEWMKANLPEHYRRLVENVGAQLEELSVGEGKRQSRGGKALKKAKKKVEMKLIQVSRSQRSKRKCVTVVLGLKTFEIDLKKASKTFAQHFSCGSSVTGEDEVVIQGDIVEEVVDFIQEQWPEVDDSSIDVIGDQKR